MDKKKGFTLTELLVTVVLLGVVATIIIFNVTNLSKNTKKGDYEKFVTKIKSAASLYADMNSEVFQDLYQNKAFIYITINDLIVSGKLDEDTINPYTNKNVGRDEIVKASLDTTNGALTFEYPLDEDNIQNETFMVAINDYVVWGEPYDCMQGVGTYQLALSDEEGNLITDVEKLKTDYHLACSLPSEFEKTSDGRYYTKDAGNYDVTYTWLTESGIKKSYTRTLNVNTKVKPGFKTYYDNKETTYDFDDLENGKMWATPEYIASENRWKYLTYKPYIEGADQETTTYSIKIQSREPVGKEIYVVGGENSYINDYETKYDAYDGDVLYTIKTIVKGHYDQNYSYDAEGQYNMRQKLILPKEYVGDISTDWTVDKDYKISDTIGKNNVPIYSKFGIAKFEYRLSNEEMKSSAVVSDNFVFDKTQNAVTEKNVNVRYPFDSCREGLKYENIYMRAINTNGFVGEWVKLDAYLTNQVDLLLLGESSGCSDCEKCCKADSGGSCYYCNKQVYAKVNGFEFILLERYNNGTMKAAYRYTSGTCEYGSKLKPGSWGVQTCDGYFTANYTYSTTLVNELKSFGNTSLTGLDDKYLYPERKGNITIPSKADFTRYGKALYSDKSYWTSESISIPRVVHVDTPFNHGESTVVSDAYLFIVNKTTMVRSYYGNCHYVKPIVTFNTLYTCEGDGTASSPYIIL